MQFVKVYPIDDWVVNKAKLIEFIETTKEKYVCEYAHMSCSDYKVRNVTPDGKTLYWDLVEYMLAPVLNHYIHKWDTVEYKICDMWFAEYYDGADFGWHVHEGCNLSAVLQIDLPLGKGATEFHDTDPPLPDLDLKEGHVVVFPAMLPHRGPVVSEGKKLVVGLNINIF